MDSPAMDKGDEDAIGRCHLCGETRPISYCPTCDHWFDRECRNRYFARGVEAIKEMTGGRVAGCCGPTE